METAAILEMVKYAFHNRCFIIDVIVRYDDITIQDVLKHPSIVARGQVLKSSKVKLDEGIPVPSFLAYPSHRVKVVSKHTFYIVNDGKAQQCVCTKVYDLILKKDWGYTIKKNRIKSLEELQQASKFPLEHMFNNHFKCNEWWCFKTIVSEEGKECNNRDN